MDANLLVFGRTKPDADPILLSAGPLTLEFHPDSGALRYFELPDGTEAIRALYPSLRYGNWGTETPVLSDLVVDDREDGFSVSYTLVYAVGYSAAVRIEGTKDEITFAYDGVAEKGFETARTGLCVLHPASLADQPVEIRHPDGTRESGRYPDLVEPHWPFREVVGVSSKMPGFKVDITMEGEVFEMEDQRNYGDASFKTYCRQQSRPFPYNIAAGERVTQTVKIAVKPWGSKVEAHPPIPDGEAGVIFIEETLPVPLIGLVAGDNPSPEALRAAPVDYLRVSAAGAADLGLPLEIVLDLSEDAEARIELAMSKIALLPEPPDRVILTPVSAAVYVPAVKALLGDILVLVGSGALVELNRSAIKPADADGLSFGFQPQGHLVDDHTLFENVEALPDLAATVAERTEGPIVAGPIRLGNRPDSRTDSLLFASWMVSVLASLVRSDVDAATLFDLEGEDGLFRDGRPIPAFHVLYDLHEFADGELVVGIGTNRRATGFALVLEENFRAIVANLTPKPLRLSVVAASDAAHSVKILDERSVERAVLQADKWRAEPGILVEPSEGIIEFELGAYGVARIDVEVDDLNEDEETFPA